MEAVPRLPMLSCELKISTTNTDFATPLKKYIGEFYHENPENYTKEIRDIDALRQSAIRVPRDFTGCRILKRYFSQLQCMQNRFPMSENGAASAGFVWNDLYSGFEYGLDDINYEQASILYNIGALHSELGAADCRTNAEGMKVACTHFQCAAWAFQHLRDTPTYPTPRGSDTSRDLLSCFNTLMLAQAQECILEKSMLDSRKFTITAKVAAQVVDYYRSALNILQEGSGNVEAGCILDTVGPKIFKHWKKFMEFKIAYYNSIAHLYMGNQAEEQQRMGDRVAWYTAALNKHSEAVKIAKSLDRDDLNEALTFTLDVIVGKCNSAKKENDFVYNEKVPAPESLPEIKGGSLVKGIPFDPTDPDICGPDIFAKLVPMEAHEASSVYSEEKAKLLRNMAAKIDEKDQELVAYMSSLQLDHDMIVPQDDTLPQEIVEICAALSVNPHAINDIKDSLKALTAVFNEVEISVKDVKRLLQLEEEREKEHQEVFGKRPHSLIISELAKECSKYDEAHRRASESNATLQKALELHLANLELLASPLDQLQRALPSLTLPDSPDKTKVIQELHMLLAKVDEMRQQRQQLEGQLRDSIQADDITKLLVARDKNQDLQSLFTEQLKKHDQITGYLEQNMGAQDNILRALTNANAHFASTRKTILEAKQRREMTVASLLNSYEAYEDLITKAQKGMDFYRKLHTNVVRLQARTKSVTSVQEEERQQIAQAQARKASKAASSYSPAITPSPSVPSPSLTSGPKLKDFLPYMTSTRSRAVVSNPDSAYVPAVAGDTTGVWNVPADQTARTANYDSTSSAIQDKIVSELPPSSYNQPVPDMIPMGVRPAPVGSEQVPPISSCTSYAPPVVSSSSYSSAEVKPQTTWSSAQSGNIPYQLPDQQAYASSNTAYTYPVNSYQYYPSGQYVTDNASGQNYPYGVYNQNAPLPSSGYTQDASKIATSTSTVISNQYAQRSSPTNTDSYTTQNQPSSNTYSPYALPPQGGSYTSVPQQSNQYPAQPPPSSSTYYSSSMATTTTTQSTSSMQYNENQYYGTQSKYPGYVDPNYVQNLPLSMTSQQTPVNAQSPTSGSGTVSSYSYYSNYNTPGSEPYSQYSTQSLSYSNISQPPSAYSQYPDGSTNPNNSQQMLYSQNQYAQPTPLQPASAMYAMPASGYSEYTNTSNYSGHQSAVSSAAAYPAPSQYSQMSYLPATSNTSPHLTYSSGNQSQYTPGHQSMQQTNTVNSCGENSIVSSHAMAQTSLPSTSYYQPVQNQNYSQYDYSSGNQQPATSLAAPSGYSDKILTPSPSASVVSSPSPIPQPKSQEQKNSTENSEKGLSDTKRSDSPASTVKSEQDSRVQEDMKSPDILDALLVNSNEEGLKPALQPKVMSLSELCSAKSLEKSESVLRQTKDPFLDSTVLDRFVAEVERYKKVVEGLTKKSLMGQMPLDQKWKEMVECQDRDSRKMSISVARCYPLKNRFPDVMPYDSNRVELHNARNDYINASFVTDLVPTCPKFIVTQAPLPPTYADFWTMVWEQQAEIIVCLLSSAELKGHIYWPVERSQSQTFGPTSVSVQSVKETPSHIESMLNVVHNETKLSRVVIHLQFTAWPPGEFPSTPSTFLQFIRDVHNYHGQQRNQQRPVIVHCSGGVGRSGAFCLLSSAVKELDQGHSPPDMSILAALACQQRKFLLQEREQLKFCYEATLYHAQDILVKRGILSNKSTFDDVLPSAGHRRTHSRHPSEDFILGGSINTKLQANNENEEQDTTAQVQEVKSENQDGETQETEESAPVLVEASIATAEPKTPATRQTSITSILDPANFTLDPIASPGKQRFTKDSFKNPSGLAQSSRNNTDPLNQLDPLWTLKKETK